VRVIAQEEKTTLSLSRKDTRRGEGSLEDSQRP